jgi:hypothetical protein
VGVIFLRDHGMGTVDERACLVMVAEHRESGELEGVLVYMAIVCCQNCINARTNVRRRA